MTKKYKILGKYIKDMSSETPDIETYIFVRDYISKYQLNIDINSKALKNKMIEINTILKFEDKQDNKKKSYFEINFSTIIKVRRRNKRQKRSRKNYTV
jgi:preprotein translocase subunit SecB